MLKIDHTLSETISAKALTISIESIGLPAMQCRYSSLEEKESQEIVLRFSFVCGVLSAMSFEENYEDAVGILYPNASEDIFNLASAVILELESVPKDLRLIEINRAFELGEKWAASDIVLDFVR